MRVGGPARRLGAPKGPRALRPRGPEGGAQAWVALARSERRDRGRARPGRGFARPCAHRCRRSGSSRCRRGGLGASLRRARGWLFIVAVVRRLRRAGLFLDVVGLIGDELRRGIVVLIGLCVLAHGDAPILQRVLGQDGRLFLLVLFFLQQDDPFLVLLRVDLLRRLGPCFGRLAGLGRGGRRWRGRGLLGLGLLAGLAQRDLEGLLALLRKVACLPRQPPQLGAVVVNLGDHEAPRAEHEMRADRRANP